MAVPVVATKGSGTPTHLLVNMKKIQMNRELQALIEKQNLIHSNKLSAIHQSHGRLDNWNFYPPRSLNAGLQRQNFNKMSYENGKILERILKRESEYGRWESEWEKVKRIQANISRYPQVTWAGHDRVTCMDYKRNTDIDNLFEGRETDSTQSRCKLKLDTIPKRADHHRKKEHLNYIDKERGLTPMQAEKIIETESKKKASCYSGQGSPYRFCKRGTVISATSEKANYKDQAKSASDQKSFSKSQNCDKCFSDGSSGEREQDDIVERNDGSREERKSKKSQAGNEGGIKLKNARKTPMSYEGSDSSQEDSDASSSFQASKDRSSSTSSHYSEMSETLSCLSINLKTRMTNTSSTSLISGDTPGLSDKVKISKTQNVYRGLNPSSQESSTRRTSIRCPETPVKSHHRLEDSHRRNRDSSQDISLLESQKSNYDLQHPTNRSTEHSERLTYSSPESLVIYPQKWPI